MAIEITMPGLSDTMEEGKILKWLKKVGDKIEVGDIIAEVETDKADMEMEAKFAASGSDRRDSTSRKPSRGLSESTLMTTRKSSR